MRAWFSTCTTPSARHQLLDQVVLLVVERRAAEVADRHRAVRGTPVVGLRLPRVAARVSTIRSAIMSIASSSDELLPCVPYGRRYFTLYSRSGLVRVALRGLALRAEPAARDRARRVALDVGDLAVLRRRRAGRSRLRSTGRPTGRRARLRRSAVPSSAIVPTGLPCRPRADRPRAAAEARAMIRVASPVPQRLLSERTCPINGPAIQDPSVA